MGPSKKKGAVRRQVLNLNSTEDSPQRSVWQNKYESILPDKEVCLNGDSEFSSSVLNNPLSGLLENYNSDSDSEEPDQTVKESLDAKVENFLKEIQSISVETTTQDQNESSTINLNKSQSKTLYLPSATEWQQCYDHNSGYPYYWNTETNEVTWEMPAELKAAIETVHKQQQIQIESNVKKKLCKYPWETDSNFENDKEFKTSQKEEKEEKNAEKSKTHGFILQASQPSIKIKGKDIRLAPEDLEAVNEFSYETSSLLAHGVQDTGPPGDESFQSLKQTKITSVKKEPKSEIPFVENCSSQAEATVPIKVELLNCMKEHTEVEKESEESADNMITESKKETSCDSAGDISEIQAEYCATEHSTKTIGIALIANYGDDSEPEDNSSNEKRENSSEHINQLFPIDITQEKIKPLFPCVGAETPKLENKSKVQLLEEPEPVSNLYNSDFEDPAVQKAFKRKKRIEFASIIYGPSMSKSSDKTLEPAVATPPTQYNKDPDVNEHHGFGFDAQKALIVSERKTYKNFDGIQFIKAETINVGESKEKETELNDGNVQKSTTEESVKMEEIEDAATLLKEKVTFLTAGADNISAIQQIAIELEVGYN